VLRLLAAVAGALALTGSAWSAPPLENRLARALDRPGLSTPLTGALAIDVEAGAVIFERNSARSFRPASTEKLTVSVAVLEELGPSFQTETVVLGTGRQQGNRWRGNLVLKGFGDPDLRTNDLEALAREIRGLGIRRVSGRIIADETYFDSKRTAPGWRARYYKVECPPLSALVVDRAVLDGRVVDDPALAAAIAFKRVLARAGVRVSNASVRGRASPRATPLADLASPPMRKLLKQMNSESDNFYAEMLTKLLGAHELDRGTTKAGTRVIRRELAERGVPLSGVRIIDGSGLSDGDRLTAVALASILTKIANDADLVTPFRSSLAVAGISGTLEDRMERPPARGRVRAKTGTTWETSALAGYAGPRYVFALIMNGTPVPTGDARAAQDRFAALLAGAQ
jgi:serine-type D-Ala-D-Ala carboxypeptidase/endopeptidase (penicillin-binding protein 4)